MASCSNGHPNDNAAKFCATCGAPCVPAPSSGGVTAPATGFRSTMKNTAAARANTPTAGYSPAPSSAPAAPTYPTPAYSPPAYAAPVYGGPAYTAGTAAHVDARPSVKGLAIAGMVLGIIADVFFFAWILGIICGIVGLVLSSVAWRRIASGTASSDGKGFAIAGFVTSLIAVGLAVLIIFAFASVFSSGL